MCKRITLVILLIASVTVGISAWAVKAEVLLTVGTTRASAGESTQVDITVGGAAKVGAFDLALRFDPAVARFAAFEPGPAANGALVMVNEIAPGRLLIALAVSEGLKNEGVLMRVAFEIAGEVGDQTAVRVSAANAYHHETFIDLPLATVDGEINVVGGGISWPTMGIGVVVVILLVLFVVLRWRSKRQ